MSVVSTATLIRLSSLLIQPLSHHATLETGPHAAAQTASHHGISTIEIVATTGLIHPLQHLAGLFGTVDQRHTLDYLPPIW